MGRAFYVESVEDAAALAGGHDRLAATLGVSLAEVHGWCAGASIPDCSTLLRV
jgi:DNA-binding transcriptional regulator YdaS (Cro superfamily)